MSVWHNRKTSLSATSLFCIVFFCCSFRIVIFLFFVSILFGMYSTWIFKKSFRKGNRWRNIYQKYDTYHIFIERKEMAFTTDLPFNMRKLGDYFEFLNSPHTYQCCSYKSMWIRWFFRNLFSVFFESKFVFVSFFQLHVRSSLIKFRIYKIWYAELLFFFQFVRTIKNVSQS